jgi:hypothetical protein
VIEGDVRYRSEVHDVDGEPMLVLWEAPANGSAPRAVADILRVDTERLGVPARTHGYRF